MSEDFFGDLGKSISRATQSAVDKTSNFFESTKITALISTEQKEIEKLYQLIGEYVVRKVEARDELVLDDEVRAHIDEIHLHLGRILDLKEELAGVKGMKICTSCQELIDAQVAFCPRCGAPVPVDEDLIEYGDAEEELPPIFAEEPSAADAERETEEEALEAEVEILEDLDDIMDAEFNEL